MSINLRNLGAELHQGLKVRAAEEGVTLQSLCVRFLWKGLDGGTDVDARAAGSELSGLEKLKGEAK